jgi:uncharacterized Zn finger protein (UPF0148 family)
MFDNVIRELKDLEKGVRIDIKMPIDDEGYLDRKCSHRECQQEFKVLMADWKEKVPDEKAYCPICGHSDKSGEWNTSEQQKYIADYAKNYLRNRLNKAFSSSAQKFNQSQRRNGWITMKMEYKPGTSLIVIPCTVAELMQQKFCCENCGCRYSSIGSSFFCPACGHNSVEKDFQKTIESVEKALNAIEVIQQTLIEHQGKDVARDTVRQIIETSLVKLTGSFQRLMESLFNKLLAAKQIKQRQNVFQNLDESSDLWLCAGCKRYEDILDKREWFNLKRMFQQRHLVSHCDGIINQRYIDKTGDATYKIGQRLVVTPESVLGLADTVKKLACLKQKEVQQILELEQAIKEKNRGITEL